MWNRSNALRVVNARRLMNAMRIAALCVALLASTGCMTVTVTDSLLVNSSVTQDKPIRAGIDTTGEAIGEVLKAAGWGGPGIDVDTLKTILEEYRKIRAMRQHESRIHPFKWELRRCPV